MKKRLLSIILAVVMIVSMVPLASFSAFAEDDKVVAKIGDVKYSLAGAVAAAETGDTVEIIEAGTYKVPNIPKNITVKGSVDGVVFDCVGSGSIAGVNGCTFENVTMNFGQSSYHGFQHAGTINMNNCTLNGLFYSYGVMNFTGCTFNAPGSEYSMWCYAGDVTYVNCTVNCAGKFANVYNEGNDGGTPWKITATGCTFNSTKTNKAAFNVKERCGAKMLNYDVTISNCTCNENFPAASENASAALYVISPLVQVDDRNLQAESTGITVTLDNVVKYPATESETSVVELADVTDGDLAEVFEDVTDLTEDEQKKIVKTLVKGSVATVEEATNVSEVEGVNTLSIQLTNVAAEKVNEQVNVISITFDVTPKDEQGQAMTQTDAPIRFRLPLTDDFTACAKVVHADDAIRYLDVKGENGAKYCEVESSTFSPFTASPMDKLPVATVEEIKKEYIKEMVDAFSEGGVPVCDFSNGLDLSELYKAYPDCLYVFEADQNDKNNAYNDWYTDFVVSFDKDIAKDSMGLAGYYASFGAALGFLAPQMVPADYKVPLLNFMTKSPNWTYAMIRDVVKIFPCGAFNLSSANNDTTMTVQLRIFDPKEFNSSDKVMNYEIWEDGVNTHLIKEYKYKLTDNGVIPYNGEEYIYAGTAEANAKIPEGYFYVDYAKLTKATETDDAVTQATAYYKKVVPVAKIGDVEYASLADAIAAVPVGVETATEIDVIAEITEEFDTEFGLVVPYNKNIVLDLNGHTVATHGTRNGSSYFIDNKGYLTIKDSSEDETGVLTYYSDYPDNTYGYGTSTLLNRGQFTLTSGKIANTTVGGASYAVDNQTLWYDDLIPVEFFMNGGTVSCTTGDAALRQAASLGETYLKGGKIVKNNITITDGTVEGDIWIQSAAVNGVGSYSTLTIEGGKITGKVYDTLTGDGSHLNYDITGGYFGTINMHRSGKGSFKTGFVSGGYFVNEVLASEVADGCECVKIAEMANPTADDTAAYSAGYIYTIKTEVKIAEVTEADKTEIKNEVADQVEKEVQGATVDQKNNAQKAATEAVEALTENTEVIKVKTNVAEAVKTGVSDIIARAAAQANEKDPGSGDAFTGDNNVKTDTKIEVKLETVKVDAQTVATATSVAGIKVNTAVYDVKPIATVTTTITGTEGTKTITEIVELKNEDLNGEKVTVRLAVAPTTATLAKVTHYSDDDDYDDEVFYAPILGTAPNQYVEIQMTHFSEVEVETLTSTINHKMGHQDKAGEPGVGRAIIPLTAEELAAIGDKLVVVYGEGASAVEFVIDCAYTYFYNNDDLIKAGETSGFENFKAFVIIENHGDDTTPISGYGHYKLYSKTGNSEKVFLFEANFTQPAN